MTIYQKKRKKKRGCTKPIDVDVEIREYSVDVRGFACFGRGHANTMQSVNKKKKDGLDLWKVGSLFTLE